VNILSISGVWGSAPQNLSQFFWGVNFSTKFTPLLITKSNIMTDTKTILYIEDDSNSRLLLKKILTQNGFKLLEAEDGLSGLEIAQNEEIDLILLDINMIGMNGYEIATRIRSMENRRNIPLVALTANVMKNTKDMALISGCNGYLTKPINALKIIDQLEEFLQGKIEYIHPDRCQELMREYNLQLVSHLEKEIKELKRANTDLKQIDKLKSDFISLASHELRTPLVTIIGYIGLLLTKRLGELPEEHKKVLKVINRNAQRLEKIVKDMFTISLIENKIPFMEIRNVNIVKTIETILEDLALTIQERELEAKLQTKGDIPLIECDEEKISQVVSNILKNSIKYTENNGKIDVVVRYPSEKILEKYGFNSQQYIDIIVEDTGIGIPIDKVNKIFDKFIELADIEMHHTSDKEFMGGGIGLGLSISRGIVDRHNGYIWAENREKKGTRLVIILPIKITNNLAFIDK
ncbi:MAG: hybrid sensor histidine kinase/response regulator, partial [Spirochaetes bacterium]|nr:hybrid sensor histidine kinase/response regulator [Spirochaetota bacterium]